MTQNVWDDVGYVIASKYRQGVVETLADGSAMPSEIVDATGHGATHVSRALKRLRDRGVIELHVPEDTTRGRIHGLTTTGHEVVERLQERDSR